MSNLLYRQGANQPDLLQSLSSADWFIEQAAGLHQQWFGAVGAPKKCLTLRAHGTTTYQNNLCAITSFVNYIEHQAIKTIVHLGIGGSMLGPELLYEAFSYIQKPAVEVIFVSSFDPKLEQLLDTLDLDQTAFVVVSKSFGTDEVLWQWSQVQSCLAKAKQLGHVFAVTSSPAKAEKADFPTAHILTIPEDVGGRFSVWSAVSASVAAAFGMDMFMALLAGAELVDQQATNKDVQSNMALAMALQAYDCLQNKKLPTRAICVYHAALTKFVDYLQQLEMESLGKRIGVNDQVIEGLTCPVVWGGAGTQMQHSVFQYIMQSSLKTPIDFIVVHGNSVSDQKYHDHMQAQISILDHGFASEIVTDQISPNPYYQVLELPELSAHAIGQLLATYEHKVVWLAAMLGLDPFTQPGVQAAKLQLSKV